MMGDGIVLIWFVLGFHVEVGALSLGYLLIYEEW